MYASRLRHLVKKYENKDRTDTCRETIFNLKLPMKKRYEELSRNLAYIQEQLDEHGINAQIQARQLYHDREEVTVHVRRLWAAVGGRRDER